MQSYVLYVCCVLSDVPLRHSVPRANAAMVYILQSACEWSLRQMAVHRLLLGCRITAYAA